MFSLNVISASPNVLYDKKKIKKQTVSQFCGTRMEDHQAKDIGTQSQGGGVLGILSDGKDFFGFEIFDSRIFLGRKIWQVFL